MLNPSSRYYTLPTFTVGTTNGRSVTLIKLRLIPTVASVTTWDVTQADRPDLVAWHFYKDGPRFWRIADADKVLDPNDSYRVPGDTVQIPTSS
jgi:hypothetical protein